MRMTIRLLLAAATIGAPLLLTAPASAASPTTPAGYEEVATARDGAQARPQRRQRRDASAQRRNRSTHRQQARRARTTPAGQG